MKKIMPELIVIGIMLIASTALATTIQTKKGPVEFNHSTHFGAFKDCLKCHDIHALGEKKASHAYCKGCHQDLGQGPTTCKGCHKK